ncbi:hypothetical protein H4R35_004027 [Dimargaris xerosporica]|nr:hypothetical protein H4R35_004027 [Dimargaris xerosporica]
MPSTTPKHETVHAYAVKAKGDPITKWEYKPRPLGDNDVEIEIDHCGVCGTDMHMGNNGAVSKLNLGDVVGVGYQAYACLKANCPACGRGLDVSCPKDIPISNGQYPDGHSAQGEFADSIRFAKAFGTTVTAFTTSANKVDESKKLGAANAVVMSDEN